MRKIIHHPKLLKLYQEVKDMLRLVLDFKRTAEEGEDTSNRREFINQIQCKYLPSRCLRFSFSDRSCIKLCGVPAPSRSRFCEEELLRSGFCCRAATLGYSQRLVL